MKTQTPETSPGSKQNRKRIVLWTALLLLLVALALGAYHAHRILTKPASLFTEAAPTPIAAPTILAPAFPLITATPTVPAATSAPSPAPTEGTVSADIPKAVPTAVETPETPGESAAPTALPLPTLKGANRLNILLMGIDAFENGKTTSGTMPHTDVMMVIAINFDENVVDLITLPRDTMTTAPGYYGYYKLNGVFNVGLGGWKTPAGKADELADGFLLTCRAAEEWLGGISIPYYYGLDFQAVIDIVNAIGGIDYDVDQPFRSHSGNHSYHRGMQHLDGDAVLGYMRIRWGADGLDSSRTARQRRMMVAIFKKLKNEGKLSQIPSLISAANSGIYTNTTLSQTTALVNYAAKLNGENIRTRSMFGEIGSIEYDWRYVYVDQQDRIDLIREVFGIEAEPVGTCTRQYERWLHRVGFSAMKYMRQAEKVLARVQVMKDAGVTFNNAQIIQYSDCYLAYTALKDSFDQATDVLSAYYAAAPWREKKNPNRSLWTSEYVDKDKEITALEQEIRQNITQLQDKVKETVTALARTIHYEDISWIIHPQWFRDQDINEVLVAFG